MFVCTTVVNSWNNNIQENKPFHNFIKSMSDKSFLFDKYFDNLLTALFLTFLSIFFFLICEY